MSATTRTIRRNPLPEVIDTSRRTQRAPFSPHFSGAGHDLVRSLIEYLEQIARRLWSHLGRRSQAPGARDEH